MPRSLPLTGLECSALARELLASLDSPGTPPVRIDLHGVGIAPNSCVNQTDRKPVMADYRGVAAVCEAVIAALRMNLVGDSWAEQMEFKVFSTQDFSSPLQTGVSLFLYRISPSGHNRTPPGRALPDGTVQRPKLPLNLHFFLTAWAREASLQNAIAGWMMRTLEDSRVLPHALLNGKWDGVFSRSETVEVVFDDVSNEDMFTIWEQLVKSSYQLTVPYIARSVSIESPRTVSGAGHVLSRELLYAESGAE